MRRLRLCACLMILTVLLVGCHDSAFDPPTYSEKQLEQARTNGFVEGEYALCLVLIDADYMRYLADTGANLSNFAFQRFEPDRSGPYVGKAVGNRCRGATMGTPQGPP